MKIVHHTKEHRAMWIGGGNETKEHPFGDPIQFVCSEWNCEINHGGYDCPRCKEKGFRRVMDVTEKKRGYCGDCGLKQLMT